MRTHAIGTALVVLTLLLGGCGAPDADPVRTSTSGEKFSSADVTFATEMIQHHAQALTMVDLTMQRDVGPHVQRLAEEIRAAQAPEIERMSDWLQDWDEPVPETVRDHANAHGDGSMEAGDMPGMLSADEMRSLEQAPAAQFEQVWLEAMIEHHEGAVEMAQTEQEQGVHSAAVKLAEQVEATQSRQIETMKGLL